MLHCCVVLCRLSQIFSISSQSQPESDEFLNSAPSKDSQSSASLQLLISQTARSFAKIERKAPFIINGTIPLDCSTRSPRVLSGRPAGARVVSLRRGESFQGRDKGPAFGRILCYCGWKSAQWAGRGSEDSEVAECRLVSPCNPGCRDSDADGLGCALQPPCSALFGVLLIPRCQVSKNKI